MQLKMVVGVRVLLFLIIIGVSFLSFAQNPQDCSKVPDHNKLKAALTSGCQRG